MDSTARQAGISAVVRVYLAAYGERHDDLAAALGVSRPAVSQKLQGRIRWTVADLDALADHFGVPVETFLAGDVLLDRLRPGAGPTGMPRSSSLAVTATAAAS